MSFFKEWLELVNLKDPFGLVAVVEVGNDREDAVGHRFLLDGFFVHTKGKREVLGPGEPAVLRRLWSATPVVPPLIGSMPSDLVHNPVLRVMFLEDATDGLVNGRSPLELVCVQAYLKFSQGF